VTAGIARSMSVEQIQPKPHIPAKRKPSLWFSGWVLLAGSLATFTSLAQPVGGADLALNARVQSSVSLKERPRVGLALSGGGARGFAHVGVLRSLEAQRIPIDCIAGTSAGAAVGAAYALGFSPDEIEAQLKSADWADDIFNDEPGRADLPYRSKEPSKGAPIGVTLGVGQNGLRAGSGIFAGQKIELFLHKMLGYSAELESFDRLPLPFRAITTDLGTGEMVVQDRGSLVHAVRASMAVPSAFAPVRIGNRMLVDGGLTQNLPVQTVRDTCADVVIAVNISSPLVPAEQLNNIFSIGLQIISILMERNVADSVAVLGPNDLLITPILDGLSAADFARGTEGIPGGEAATWGARERLQKWAVPEEVYQGWQKDRQKRRLVPPDIDKLEVASTRFVTPDYFSLPIREGAAPGPLEVDKLNRQIGRWTSSGDFTNIGYVVRPREDGYTLWIEPQEKEWGPNYLQLGFAGVADSSAYADFSVSALLRRTWQNRHRAEWRTQVQFGRTRKLETRWIQPLALGSPWYVEPRLSLTTEPRRVFVGDKLMGQFKTERSEFELGMGLQGKAGEAHFGLVSARTRTEPSSGFSGVESFSSDISGWRLRLNLDSLDELDFPRQGSAFRLETFSALPVLGASSSYQRTDVEWLQVLTRGDHTVRTRLAYAQVDTNGRETLDLVSTGGFMRLSGYQSGQFLSRGAVYGSVSYYQQLFGLPQPLGSGVFAGVSLETARLRSPLGLGSAQLQRSGMAFYLGASTALGPAYVGLGLGQGGQKVLYLFLGRP
jgi:NTE family protein